jgi:fermentation-respiration switch protein FrsA (DUF1100 family)
VKNDPIENALAKLDDANADLAKALGSKYPLVAAKAARLIGDRDRRDLAPQVASSFKAMLAASGDKGCTGKLAMARALNKLEYDDAELFIAGMRHVQMEGSWGGSEDVAANLRAVCAMCLMNSTYFYKLRELTTLLADKEWPARSGAVRALAAAGGDSAGLLLRYKALIGDIEEDVMSDCYIGLLAVEGGAAVPLVASIGSETAILALGESRLGEAVEALKELFGRRVNPDDRKCILLSLSTSRTEAAIECMTDWIRKHSTTTACDVVRALAIHRHDARIYGEVERAVEARRDREVESVFSEQFALH